MPTVVTAAQLDAIAVLRDLFADATRELDLGLLELRRRKGSSRRGSWRSERGLLPEHELVLASALQSVAAAARKRSAGMVFLPALAADFEQSCGNVLKVAD